MKESRKVTLAGETICGELYLLSQKDNEQQATLFAVGLQTNNTWCIISYIERNQLGSNPNSYIKMQRRSQ